MEAPQIQGLPPGAVVTPIAGAAPPQIEGLPPGATVTPISGAPPAPAPQPSAPPSSGSPAADAQAGGGEHWYSELAQQAGEAVGGVKKGINETGLTAMKAIHAVPGVGAVLDKTKFGESQAETQKNADAPVDTVAGKTGYALENIAEFMSGDEALKGLTSAEKLMKIAPVLKMMEKFPRMREALAEGLKAVKENPIKAAVLRNALLGEGQAEAHGASRSEALTTGAISGVVGGAAEAIPAAYSGVKSLMAKIRPDTTEIAGEVIPRLASQKPNAAPIAGRLATSADTPEIAAQQQARGQQAIQNVAHDATRGSIERINLTRKPPAETPAGPAEPPIRFKVDTPGDPAVPGSSITVDTADPAKAQSVLSRLQDAQDSDTFASLPKELRKQVYAATNTLKDQLGMHHAAESIKPHFDAIDPATVMQHVSNFGEAADQIEAAVQPVYQTLDAESGGNFRILREQVKTANKVMRQPSTMEAYSKAADMKQEAEDGIEAIFNRSSKVNMQELKSTKSAWRDAAILKTIHSTVEGAFAGAPKDIADANQMRRLIKGDNLTARLNQMLKKTSREDVARVIGPDGLTNLYRVADLLSKPETSIATNNLAKEVGRHMTGRVGKGAFLGGMLGSTVGHTAVGAAAGSFIEDAQRFVLRQAAINPKVGMLVDRAVRHQVSLKVAAPLIAATLNSNNTKEEPSK